MQLKKRKLDWKEVAEGILVVIFCALFFRSFIFTNYKVPTNSMSPILNAGDFFLGSRLYGSYKIPFTSFHFTILSVSRGDIVTFRLNEDSRVMIARRIVGVENDVVEVRDQGLFLNGARLRDVGSDAKDFSLKVPTGQFFAACEQAQPACDDSVSWGALPLTQIQSKALFIWLSTGEDSFHLRSERISHWVTNQNPSLI